MDTFAKRFAIDASPVAVEGQSFTRGNVRFTVITPCLLRVEVQKKGLFCDEATQSVWFRDFDAAKYEIKEDGDEIEIKMDEISKMEYDLVRILGREFVGIGVVGPNAFCKIVH